MLAVSGGRLLAMSTPFGTRGWWYEAWRSNEDWERYEVPAERCPRISAAFLDENRSQAVRIINNGAVLLDALYDNRRAGISGSIATNALLGPKLQSILKEGFALTDAQMRTDAPPYYTAADRPRLSGAAFSGNGTKHPESAVKEVRTVQTAAQCWLTDRKPLVFGWRAAHASFGNRATLRR